MEIKRKVGSNKLILKEHAQKVLEQALYAGADFAELFLEESSAARVGYNKKQVDDIVSGTVFGAGIRLIKGVQSVYASTSDITLESLLSLAKNMADILSSGKEQNKQIILNSLQVCKRPAIIRPVQTVNLKEKIAVAKACHDSALSFDAKVTLADVNYLENTMNVTIINSEGLYKSDSRVRTRLFINAVASNGTENQSAVLGPGASQGFELFETVDPVSVGKEAAESAVVMLTAKDCPGGKMSVAIENGFGGVLFHEACGHSLEGEQVAQGNSEFTGKIGQKIASDKVTAIDDGTIDYAWGSIGVDDEGHKPQRNVLIENGILKGYMLDRLNAKKLNMQPTGNGRRQSYKYASTSRMTNTFIAPGNDNDQDIIASMDYGIYCKKMGGGQVNPVTGEFNFSVAEGYLVQKGEIQYPVRGASLIGKGSDVLQKIDMVGKNLALGQGMCGSSSGSVPTSVGQPLIRVSEITVGGK